MLLELTNHVRQYAALAHNNQWADRGGFCVLGPVLEELEGKTFGIIGFGAIGQQVARIASAFGMQVKVWSRTPRVGHNVVFCSQQELLQQSDVISLHCPLTPETRHLINHAALAQMKPSAILLNTSRGALIDEAALFTALSTGKLAAAGLDVLNEEPPARDHPLLSLPNCLVTPHIAWNGKAARGRVLKIMAENVAAFLQGQPQNVVN